LKCQNTSALVLVPGVSFRKSLWAYDWYITYLCRYPLWKWPSLCYVNTPNSVPEAMSYFPCCFRGIPHLVLTAFAGALVDWLIISSPWTAPRGGSANYTRDERQFTELSALWRWSYLWPLVEQSDSKHHRYSGCRRQYSRKLLGFPMFYAGLSAW